MHTKRVVQFGKKGLEHMMMFSMNFNLRLSRDFNRSGRVARLQEGVGGSSNRQFSAWTRGKW